MRAQTRPRGRLDRDFKDGPTCIGESSDISVAPHLRSGAVKGRNVSEWDGPAVLPPRNAQRMCGGLEARGAYRHVP